METDHLDSGRWRIFPDIRYLVRPSETPVGWVIVALSSSPTACRLVVSWLNGRRTVRLSTGRLQWKSRS
jgi:hypothetical protein